MTGKPQYTPEEMEYIKRKAESSMTYSSSNDLQPTPDPYQHKVENACQMLYKTLSEFDEEIGRIEQQLKVIRQARLILHKNVSDILSESSKVKVSL